MAKMTESDIEVMAIEHLQGLGYEYVYGPDIEPSGINPLRSYQQVILEDKVRTALQRINPHLSEQKCEEALKQVMQISSPDLMANNLTFHRLLTEGINIEVSKDGNTQGELASLIDFNDPLIMHFWSLISSPSKKATIPAGRILFCSSTVCR